MNEMKITIDQLKNYLGTGLKFETSKGDLCSIIGIEQYPECNPEIIFYHHSSQSRGFYGIEHIHPQCYRLSDLDKFIPELGFVPFKRLLNNEPEKDDSIEIEFIEGRMPFQKRFRAFAWVDYPDGESRKEHLSDFFLNSNHGMVPFSWMQQLFQWHFWPFGDEYFQAGLVIDKLAINLPSH